MANYYVSTTGSNANAGTTTAGAWATIARAGSAGSVVTVGDVVNVLAGTYVLSGFATAKANITYLSPVKWGAVLDGRGSGVSAASVFWNNSGSGVTIDGFDVSTHGRIGIACSGGNNNIVKNCYVHDVLCQGNPGGAGGAGIQGDGSGWSVHHNTVLRIDAARVTGTSHVHGIYISGATHTIYDNLVGSIASCGIQQWHGADQGTIYNNTCFNCTAGFLIGGGDAGVLPNGSTDNKIFNNISRNSTYGFLENGTGGSHSYVNNCVFSCTTNFDQRHANSNATGTILADPKHVAYLADGTGDYHLSAGSPCIGAASTLHVPSDDLDNVSRPQGGTYDIGAYEFVVGGGGDTTPPTLTLPTGTQTGQTTADIGVTTNDATGTMYYWATTNPTETAAAIAANGATFNPTSASGKLWHITGLTANTTYYAHFIHDDSVGNRSAVANSASFTTLAGSDTTAPVLTLPTAASSDPNIADMTVTTNEANGTLYCWVTQNATETAANIIATTTDTAIVTTTGVQSVTVDLLFPNTNYYGHFVHVDAANNQSNVVHTTVFQTEPAPAGVNRPGIGGNLRRRFHIR